MLHIFDILIFWAGLIFYLAKALAKYLPGFVSEDRSAYDSPSPATYDESTSSTGPAHNVIGIPLHAIKG